jgi:hypothetical protein
VEETLMMLFSKKLSINEVFSNQKSIRDFLMPIDLSFSAFGFFSCAILSQKFYQWGTMLQCGG